MKRHFKAGRARQMEVGEVMPMEYAYGSTWTRKVKLVEISDNQGLPS